MLRSSVRRGLAIEEALSTPAVEHDAAETSGTAPDDQTVAASARKA